jgi:hypothetical protein
MVEKDRAGAGQQRGALIDLVERVGAEHQGLAAGRIDHALGEGEEGLARTVHRQHLVGPVRLRDAVAARQPAGDGLAQGVAARGRGIIRQARQAGGQRFLDEGRRRVLRLADRQPDLAEAGRRPQALEQLAQFLERVGLEQVEIGVHVGRAACVSGCRFFSAKRRL